MRVGAARAARLGRSMLDVLATADSMMARLLKVKAFIGLPFFIGRVFRFVQFKVPRFRSIDNRECTKPSR